MGMEAGLDTGPMYLTRRTPISPEETGNSLHDRLAGLGAAALMQALPGIADGTLKPEPQDDSLAAYANKLAKEEAQVDWSRPAVELDRMIRAFDPWPVAQTRLGEKVLRLWGCELRGADAEASPPGLVLNTGGAGIDVATGEGVLRITRLQLPGKRPMSAAEFLNARELKGESLG
jgi:methionyl-tRNA formyltransferase